MKPETILNADLLDILFEHRNKDYGAYTLRRDYNRRLLKGLLFMLLVVTTFVTVNYLKFGKTTRGDLSSFIPPDQVLTTVDLTKPLEPPPPPPKKQQAASIQYTAPLLVKETESTLPEIEKVAEDVQVSTITKEGPPPVPSVPVSVEPEVKPSVPAEEPPPAILDKAEFMPEYPGGEAAMRRFLQRQLRFDFENMEAGTRITIRCRFVVDEEGKVTSIQILKSGGRNDFDNEVTRVVGAMPKWKPGSQNGRIVKVYFTLPVVVEVPEQ